MSRPSDDLPSIAEIIATEPDLAAAQRLIDAAKEQRRGRLSDRDAEVESLRARVAQLTNLPSHHDLDGIVREVDRLPLAFRDMARALLRMAWVAGAMHGAERFGKPPTVVVRSAAAEASRKARMDAAISAVVTEHADTLRMLAIDERAEDQARREGRDAERARVLALIDEDRRDLRDARRPDEHRALSALRHAVADGQQPKERTRG